MITLKLTDGEFLYLVAIFGGGDGYDERDCTALRDKVMEAYAPKKKPKPNHVWEALKGVVG